MSNKNTPTHAPIVGICSFAKYPICTDLEELDADAAVLGVPYDLGIGFLSGTRLGPRRIREVSTHYGRGDAGFYDPETDEVFLAAPWKIVDCGDADVVIADVEQSFINIETSVAKIVEKGAIPVVMGGDHSITYAVCRGLKEKGPFTVVQFDAHLDWSRQHFGNGTPMRNMSGLDYVEGMAQVGIRGLGSSRKEDFEDARAYGSVLIPAKEAKAIGVEGVMAKIPQSEKYFVTIDIDSLDLTYAPGAGSPSPGGFTFDELNDMLAALAKKGEVVGFDLVEVAPQYDPAGVTPRVAAMTILNFLGQILKQKEKKGEMK
ncbi:agmatinase [Rubeoparvulum massiliense]|uniref:agmatinase n=1 Tax=Rubeoparvulum massiliense TaxID=1631346 RepID=UPI00065DDDD1|nr:agmatinase [Rubeoparvulum massiliense]